MVMHTPYGLPCGRPPGIKPGYEFRHHAGSWNRACPHSRRAGMTVVPSPACPACVKAGEAAKILSRSACGSFEFLLFRGYNVVVCLRCWRYGKPDQNHECSGNGYGRKLTDGKPPVHPKDEYLERMLDVVGIEVCPACEGKCSVWPDKAACRACGGTGRLREQPNPLHALSNRIPRERF